MPQPLVIRNSITLTDALEGQPRRIRVPVLRRSTFKAGRYGTLEFTDAFLDKIIENFNNRVVGNDVALDVAHRPEMGAPGWIHELRKEGSNPPQLVAYGEPTPLGLDLIGNKVYKYASAEIDQDYIDRETGESYGPALLGIALTNRPYIHKQDAVALFSNDGNPTYQFDGDQGETALVPVTTQPQETTIALFWSEEARRAAALARRRRKVAKQAQRHIRQTQKAQRKAVVRARKDELQHAKRLAKIQLRMEKKLIRAREKSAKRHLKQQFKLAKKYRIRSVVIG